MARTFDHLRIDLGTRPSGNAAKQWMKVRASLREDEGQECSVTVDFAIPINPEATVASARQTAVDYARGVAQSFVALASTPAADLLADEVARDESYDGDEPQRSKISI